MNELRVSPWHLKYFYDSIRLKSLTKAAEQNGISRPAISKAIVTLETALEAPLLKHGRRKVEPTEEGLRLYERAPAVFEALRDLREDVSARNTLAGGTLRVGTSHSLALAIFPKLLADLTGRYPGLDVSLQLGRTELLRRWLDDDTIDIALSLDDARLSGFEQAETTRGSFILHGEGRRKDGLFLVTADRPEVRALKRWAREKFAGSPPVYREIDSWEVMFRLSQSGLGTTLIPDFVLAKRPRAKASDFSFEYRMVAFWRKGLSANANMRAFVEAAHKAASRTAAP